MRHMMLCSVTALAALLFFAPRYSVHAADTGVKLAALSVGDYVPDFKVLDKDGRTIRFSSIRGNVTILAFVAVKPPETSKVLEPLHKLAMSRTSLITDVEYVGISEPPVAEPDPNAKVKLCPDAKLWHGITLYDEGAKVMALYGVKNLDICLVIDDNGRITGIGDANDLDAVTKALDKAVRKANLSNSYFDQPY